MENEADNFFQDIAEDFFAECDELLSLMKKSLLTIDELKGREVPPRSVLEDLLRSSHTLKGLTGMVGAGEITQLTHTFEDYLKAVYEGNLHIPPESLDIVFSAINVLELQMSAFRNKSEMPDISGILESIQDLLPTSDIDKIKNKNTAQLINERSEKKEYEKNKDYPAEGGEIIWKFYFTPDKELFEKGININSIRSRLQEAGRVLRSVPKTGEDGSITFEFIVASNKPESLFQSWTPEGVRYEMAGEKEQVRSGSSLSVEQAQLKNVVRVDLAHLDDIMRIVGDLVISRSRLNDHINSLRPGTDNNPFGLQETNILMERQLRDLRENVMKLRLVSIGETFERMKFVVRDLIRESKKSIELELSGQETHIDKYIMEKMFDPLLHLVRNAVSHGIEASEERRASGKPSAGKVSLRATAAGDAVNFSIEDDGRGIDRQSILEKAVRMGMINSTATEDDHVILDIICSPGFSTREETDVVSGRGVGMNIVRKTVRELGGGLDFESEKGKGTRFLIQLPLTLSIVDALIVTAGGQVFAVPLPVINEVISIDPKDLIKTENNEIISHRDIVLPVLRLCRFFHLPEDTRAVLNCFVVGQGIDRTGIIVDKIIGKREIVVRSLSDPTVKVEGISGATELGEGKIVLIIDAPAMIRSVIKKNRKKYKVAI